MTIGSVPMHAGDLVRAAHPIAHRCGIDMDADLARVPGGELGEVRVDIRGKQVPVRVVKFPFVREGQPQPGVLIDG